MGPTCFKCSQRGHISYECNQSHQTKHNDLSATGSSTPTTDQPKDSAVTILHELLDKCVQPSTGPPSPEILKKVEDLLALVDLDKPTTSESNLRDNSQTTHEQINVPKEEEDNKENEQNNENDPKDKVEQETIAAAHEKVLVQKKMTGYTGADASQVKTPGKGKKKNKRKQITSPSSTEPAGNTSKKGRL